MKRRSFLAAVTAAIGGTALGSSAVQPVAAGTAGTACDYDRVEDLVFNQTSSLLDANQDRLEDDSIVFVYSEDSADGGSYSNEAVPLWARDGNYFGSGSLLVDDIDVNDNEFTYGQEEVLLNIIDDYTGGSGHVVYDESASQGYTLASHFTSFSDWVQGEGYTIEASTDLTADLDGADALLVTLPGGQHASDQITAIQDFAAAGNPVFLFNEADSWDTPDLNYLADQLGLAFRFDDDAVTDEPGWEWDDWPITGNYDDDTYPNWFQDREGMGFEPGYEYTAVVDEVVDGDTFDIVHQGGYYDGRGDTIRHLGFDTPETGSTSNNSDEWYGIEDEQHLDDWGTTATNYADDSFSSGDEITFYVDANESTRGDYARLLAYHNYPESSSDSDIQYNRDMVAKGYAKLYNSGYDQHDQFFEAYADALSTGTGVWSASDPDATGEVYNDDVTTLRFRSSRSVTTDSGSLEASRTAVWSGSDDPLVGVDEANNVALVGGLMNSDNWEGSSDENFVFSANLAKDLADVSNTEQRYLMEGGHNQFAASYDFSYEGKETFMRFLEGLDAMEKTPVNHITPEYVTTDRAHVIVITPPEANTCYSTSEVDQLQTFADNGGSILLKADTDVAPGSVQTLNELAAELGSDLRFAADDLGDVETSNFNTADFALWSAYDTSGSGGGGDGVATSTDAATDVTESSATLNGTLDDLGGADSADCYFEWGPAGDLSNTTSVQTLSSTGSFSEGISGLDSGTDYEFRAVADASDGDTDTGSTGSFTTDSGDTGDSAPAIDQFGVTDDSNPGWNRYDVDWAVSDPDGDLQSVTTEMLDSSGSILDSDSDSVSGGSASGSHSVRSKSTASEIRLTVTDSADNQTTETQSV